MFDAGTVRNSIRRLYAGTVHEHGCTPKTVSTLLRDLDCAALAAECQRKARRVYAFETRGRHPLSLHFRGRDLFGQQAVRIYEDVDAFTSGLPMASHATEVWLQENGKLTAVSCVKMHYQPGDFDTEYREIQGCPWDCGLELKEKALTENLRHLGTGLNFEQ